MNWDDYKNFSKKEFDCKHTGENKMRPEFMGILQQIRTTFNKPMTINSGYRAVSHPIEQAKKDPGEHCFGCAADIAVRGEDVMALLAIAYGYGIRRFGIYQKGRTRFVHLGYGDKELNFPPTTWTG